MQRALDKCRGCHWQEAKVRHWARELNSSLGNGGLTGRSFSVKVEANDAIPTHMPKIRWRDAHSPDCKADATPGISIVKAEKPAAPKPWLEHDQNILGLCGCSFLLRGSEVGCVSCSHTCRAVSCPMSSGRAVSWLSWRSRTCRRETSGTPEVPDWESPRDFRLQGDRVWWGCLHASGVQTKSTNPFLPN